MKYEKLSGFSDEIASDIKTQFEVLNKLGIKSFEPRGINGKNISELTDDEVATLKAEMQRYKITASSIGSPIGKIKISDDFENHFELFKRVVEIAKTLECKYIRMFSFYNDGGEWTKDKRSEVFKRLRKMIEYATEHGVVLLHENEKDIYGDSVGRCFDLMKEFYCENFAIVFDPANFVQSGEDTKQAFAVLKDYIRYVHIKDSLRSDNSIVPAGHGDGNISYILENLLKSGFKGYISLEPHLGTFDGLDKLEISDEMLKLPKGGEGTFTLAYNALMEIIENI